MSQSACPCAFPIPCHTATDFMRTFYSKISSNDNNRSDTRSRNVYQKLFPEATNLHEVTRVT